MADVLLIQECFRRGAVEHREGYQHAGLGTGVRRDRHGTR